MAIEDSKPKTINELADAIMVWARAYYRHANGSPTKHAAAFKAALDPLRELAGEQTLDMLKAELFYALQQRYIERGLARQSVNKYLKVLRTALRWACRPPQRYIPVEVITEAELVEPLKIGRTRAPEAPGVKPVDWSVVEQTFNVAPPWLRVMIWCHWHSGARPGEIVRMKKSELREDGDMVIYTPAHHKNAWRGHKRTILFNPKAQELLRPWLSLTISDDIFPIKCEGAYYQGIKRLIDQHDLPRWSAGQVRHSMATRVRKAEGIEAASLVLGHRSLDTTLIYAAADEGKAAEVLRKIV